MTYPRPDLSAHSYDQHFYLWNVKASRQGQKSWAYTTAVFLDETKEDELVMQIINHWNLYWDWPLFNTRFLIFILFWMGGGLSRGGRKINIKDYLNPIEIKTRTISIKSDVKIPEVETSVILVPALSSPVPEAK